MYRLTWRRATVAFFGFVLLAVLQAWPLPLHLSTHLTGPPGGDTGVYVWNTWVFRHEIVEGNAVPFFTSSIFAAEGRPANLSLHNYTTFANLLTFPLQPLLGVVASFNLVYLLNVALAGLGLFVLAHARTGRLTESWLAGAAFACAPFLVARSTGHFSLVAAAPLPIFLWMCMRAWHSERRRDAVLAGIVVAWAAFCDPYYAVYCLMLAGAFIGTKAFELSRSEARAARSPRAVTALNVVLLALGGLIVGLVLSGGGVLRLGAIRVSMRSLYTPVLLFSALAAIRLVLAIRPRLARRPLPPLGTLLRMGSAAALASAILLSPVLYAVAVRIRDGSSVSTPTFWRTSPAGIDLLALVLPDPNHPLMPAAVTAWLQRQPGGVIEQAGMMPLVALLVIAIAWGIARFRPSWRWIALAGGFTVLSLGPFVHIAGINTFIPTPWTLLRYVPMIGSARMPTRFAVVALVGVCVLMAGALAALTARFPAHRRWILGGAALALAGSILPIPRTLYSAEIPGVYRRIAADARDIRVLELPLGVRDGVSSVGNFSALSQYFQTSHGKPLVGGYLSRVSDRRKVYFRRHPVLGPIGALSEGLTISPERAAAARLAAPGFLARVPIGYVVFNDARGSADLRAFAIETLGLEKIETSGAYSLYRPRVPLVNPGS